MFRRWCSTVRGLAELALRTCRSPYAEVARLDRRLPAALVVSQPELAGQLRRSVLGGLAALDPARRGLLLETLDAWLECGGSATAAASRLYCHPNTVLNRLRRIEELSGRSTIRPLELVELAFALCAFHHEESAGCPRPGASPGRRRPPATRA